MLQIELSLARIVDPAGAPRAGSGLRPRFGWMERRRPHPPARFICALSGFGLGEKLRRHFNPPWWGSVRSVGHGTIYRRVIQFRHHPKPAARRERCVARCRRRCASAAPASPGLARAGCGVSTTLSSDGTGSYGDGGSPGSVASGAPARRLPKVIPVMDRAGLTPQLPDWNRRRYMARSGLPT